MVKTIVEYLALITAKAINYKWSDAIGWLFDLFYTSWIKYELKECGGRVNRYIKVKGGEYIRIVEDTTIDSGTKIEAWDNYEGQKYSPDIVIKNNSLIGSDCQISCVDKIYLGNNVAIASRCLIIDNVHSDFRAASFTFDNGTGIPDVYFKNAFTRNLYSKGPFIIENNVHIGENSTIMPGVIIGNNSVVSSNSVVLHDVKPYSIVSGNPAKMLCYSE